MSNSKLENYNQLFCYILTHLSHVLKIILISSNDRYQISKTVASTSQTKPIIDATSRECPDFT